MMAYLLKWLGKIGIETALRLQESRVRRQEEKTPTDPKADWGC
jgi:hypothetical protein